MNFLKNYKSLIILGFSSGFLNSSENNSPIIAKVVIEGNKIVSEQAIKNALSYKIGDKFRPEISSQNIRSVNNIGYFDEIKTKIEKENLDSGKICLYIAVEEKPVLTGFEFEGNSVISSKKLSKALDLDSYKAISEHDIKILEKKIIKEYKDSNYFDVIVKGVLEEDQDSQEEEKGIKKCFLKISIIEGVKTALSRVHFKGCKKVPESQIRNFLLTKEDWLFSFIDGAGRFSKDAIERDKSVIQEIYQNKGFLFAKVTDVEIKSDDKNKALEVTFTIQEGEQSRVRFITLPDDDEFSRHSIKKALTFERGEIYSKKKILDSMERIKILFGSKGYIYCDVYPDIKPVENLENTVDIELNVEKGEKYFINDLVISGNKKTQDRVIRRELIVSEGQLATKAGIDISKDNVEALGYFERDHVDWKIKRIDKNKVDLELNVQEARTGHFSGGLTYSPDGYSDKGSMKGTVSYNKRNFMGLGWDIASNADFGIGALRKFDLSFFNPYIFDNDILFSFDTYFSNLEYERQGNINFKQTSKDNDERQRDINLKKTVEGNYFSGIPVERTLGGCSKVGFTLFPNDSRIKLLTEIGIENIDYKNLSVNKPSTNPLKQIIEKDKFRDGTLNWLGLSALKDKRNHPLYPSNGYRLELKQKYAFGITNSDYSFIKTELSAAKFIPLIGKDRLVLSLSGRAGFISEISDSKKAPYKELYHVGGPGTIRGFRWGEAGPSYKDTGYPLGAKKLLLCNVELVAPLTFENHVDMYTPRGYLFYDFGTGYDTPRSKYKKYSDPENLDLFETVELANNEIRNNDFNFRHTIGIGLKLTAPQPIKIEWGYKLDRKYGSKERPSELQITMNIPI